VPRLRAGPLRRSEAGPASATFARLARPRTPAFRVSGSEQRHRVSGFWVPGPGFGFRARGLKFRVQGAGSFGFSAFGFRVRVQGSVSGLGVRVSGFEFRFQSPGFGGSGFEFRVQGAGFGGFGSGLRARGSGTSASSYSCHQRETS